MSNGIVPTIKLSMELTKVLADIEMNGLHINTDILTSIKVKFEKELVDLQKYLNEKVKIFYVISGNRYGDKIKKLYSRTIKIIKSITKNFTIENSIYGSKGTYKDNKIIKSDPVYLIVYDKIAEDIHKQLKQE